MEELIRFKKERRIYESTIEFVERLARRVGIPFINMAELIEEEGLDEVKVVRFRAGELDRFIDRNYHDVVAIMLEDEVKEEVEKIVSNGRHIAIAIVNVIVRRMMKRARGDE